MEDNVEITFFDTLNKEAADLLVYQCGMEKCKPSYSFGPAVRDHFLIHYILEGSGAFYVDGKSYKLQKNQGFLICPDVITRYEADNESPWIYTWVGFRGIKAESCLKLAGLSRENPIFQCENDDIVRKCFEDMRNSVNLKYGKELRLQGLLCIFLSELIENCNEHIDAGNNYKEIYIKKTLQFIEASYSHPVRIGEMAQNIGLNRNYFSSFFKENMGISPQEYLMKYRINKACELMKNKLLSISDISRSVGYSDPLAFSKVFRKIKGKSPKSFRQGI
ncbi:MAG: AraC family transcriptional regulator [Clostridiaceae bacterium]